MIWSMAYLENGKQFHLDQWQKNQNLVSSKIAFINLGLDTLLLNEGILRALKGKKLHLKKPLLLSLIFEEINYF